MPHIRAIFNDCYAARDFLSENMAQICTTVAMALECGVEHVKFIPDPLTFSENVTGFEFVVEADARFVDTHPGAAKAILQGLDGLEGRRERFPGLSVWLRPYSNTQFVKKND